MQFSVLAKTFEKLEETTKRLEMTDILAELFEKTDSKDIKKVIYLIQNQVEPPFKGVVIGMGEKFVERAIAKVSGNDTKKVRKLYEKKGDLGETGKELLADKKQTSLGANELTVSKVYKNFYDIAEASGAGSQGTKINKLSELLNNASPLEARYIIRIPLEKLRLGIGDPTILDALSVKEKGDKSLREELERAYNICSDLGEVAEVFYKKGVEALEKFKVKPGNPVRPMAGERLSTPEEIIAKLGKCAIEKKYDGMRCIVHKKKDKIWIFSRNQDNITHMFPEIVEAVKKLKQDLIIEGEALLYNKDEEKYMSFQETIQRKRKHGIEKYAKKYPLSLFIFDCLYYDGKDLTQKEYKTRREYVEKIKETDVLKHSGQIITDRAEELEKFFNESVKGGLEGIMAKDLEAPYYAGSRKFAWIKLKKSYQGALADTVDAVILGYYRGRGSRTQFGFGGFLAGVYDKREDKFKSICKVGTGFSEDQMKELKEKLDEIKVKNRPARVDSQLEPDFWVEPKYVVELNADEISNSPVHTADGKALRFPRLVSKTFVDKKPEQATTIDEIKKLYEMQG